LESFDPVTRQGLAVTNLFWFVLAISAVLLALVIVWLGTALVRFRARGEAGEPAQVHGNRRLELIWTITPAFVLALVFVLVVQTIRTVDAEMPGAQPLRIVGHQWWWEYVYPDQQAVTANELHVAAGAPLQVTLESIDVIHSFHVPQFGWMQDAVPGKQNYMWILPERPGVYAGFCKQYCGVQHAWMQTRVVIETPDQFRVWLDQQRQPATPSGSQGEQVFRRNTCVACHVIRGVAGTANIGPDLTHLGGRATLGGSVVANTPDNLRNWIRNAQTVKPGVLMPPFQTMNPADLDALVEYLGSLN
jgi:cytochrome c oxidase subunit II